MGGSVYNKNFEKDFGCFRAFEFIKKHKHTPSKRILKALTIGERATGNYRWYHPAIRRLTYTMEVGIYQTLEICRAISGEESLEVEGTEGLEAATARPGFAYRVIRGTRDTVKKAAKVGLIFGLTFLDSIDRINESSWEERRAKYE